MCTLSWWRDKAAYGVLFNRDESRQRQQALPPALSKKRNTRYLSPLDPDGGGTWMWVNEYGVIGCLLNNYQIKKLTSPNPVSRGRLMNSLVGLKSAELLQPDLAKSDLKSYKGFHLFCMDRHHHLLATWNCDRLEINNQETITRPITSSGYLPHEIVPFRIRLFNDMFPAIMEPSPQELHGFHTFQDPDFPAHSVLMCRPDARTHSLSKIVVDEYCVDFIYHEISDRCLLQPPLSTRLSREI